MKNFATKFPRHAACGIGLALLCLVIGFDTLLVRAVVVEGDWQQDRFCQFNPGPDQCH